MNLIFLGFSKTFDMKTPGKPLVKLKEVEERNNKVGKALTKGRWQQVALKWKVQSRDTSLVALEWVLWLILFSIVIDYIDADITNVLMNFGNDTKLEGIVNTEG